MLLLRPPGVYRPQADTWLLVRALAGAAVPPGANVLDVGTGTGALALAAARAGAASVTAVDVSRRAVLTARLNAVLRGRSVRVRRGRAPDCVRGQRFDLVLANPPYVPSHVDGVPRWGAAVAWNAGRDGRAVLDPLCAAAPDLLAPGGVLLLAHSALCGVERTLRALRDGGLKAAVVARHDEPFGPVLRARAAWLERRGLVAPGQRHEELVVVRADRPAR